MNTNNINEQVDLKITQQLYLHTPFAIYSTLFNTLIVLYVFHNIANTTTLFAWAGVTIIYLLFRLFFCRYVLKKQITLHNLKQRARQFTVTICLSGIIFGSAGVLLLAKDYPAYNAFIFFLMGGMFAGSTGAFAIKQRVFYAFSAPIILPVTIYSFMLGGKVNMAMSFMGIIFTLMMVAVVRRMNVPMTEALTLSIENKSLAEKTRQLNEQLKDSNERLKMLSFKDTMTNVCNRRYISEILNPEIERFSFTLQRALMGTQTEHIDAQAQIYGIYIIDIDHFKDVNDSWGHTCGDAMIIQFVDVIKALIRKEDTLCRWGGEEFIVILKRTDPEYIKRFAQKIITAVNETKFSISESVTIHKTCSLGYARFPFFAHLPLALSLDQTIEIADQALYHAKENGRNKAVLAEYNQQKWQATNLQDTHTMMKELTTFVQDGRITLS